MSESKSDDATGIEAVETPMGVAVLKANPDDGPLQVRGVALSEGDVTLGASGIRKFWPREVLEPAAEGLVGTKITDDSQHDVPEDGDINSVPKQPSVDAIVGEVTDAKYEPGIGVVYEGEIDDPDIASLVENGRVEVSPFVFHQMEEPDDQDVAPVKDIAHWRDLSVVSEGAGSDASITPADSEDAEAETDSPQEPATATAEPQPAAAAMSAAALTAVLDTSFDDSVTDTPTPTPTPTQSEETEVEADAEIEDEDAEADVDDEAEEPETEAEAVAEGVANGMAEAEETPSDAEAEADGDADGDADAEALISDELAESSADSDSDITDSTMELTEDEEKFVNKARALDNPVVVEADVEALADTAEDLEIDQFEEPEVIEAEDYEEPTVVETEEFDSLTERVEIIEDFMAKRLAEKTGMKEETAGALSLDAMFSEFEDEDGEFDAEALVQDPVSGDSGAGDTESPDDEPEAEALEAKQEEQEEIELELEALQQKRSVLGNTSIAARLDEKIETLEAKKEEI